ncbi:MAG: transposase [Opitutales bacterium]|nr:transposase [Opitutales bacterium]
MKRLKYGGRAVYHLMSRAVHREFLLNEEGKDALRGMMRSQAAFCGVEVLTYCLMSNHFHILVGVDPEQPARLEDSELVARVAALYGSQRVPSLGVDADDLAVLLMKGGSKAEDLRRRLRARMGDVSVFMKELKTRFSWWYNETFQTVGTFWAERFQSVLIEETSPAVALVAAYIDLNPVRAGIVEDPADHGFCGFAEASKGGRLARAGLATVLREGAGGPEIAELYRKRVLALPQLAMRPDAAMNEGGKCTAEEAVSPSRRLWEKACGFFAKGLALGSLSWIERLRELAGCASARGGRSASGLPAGIAAFRRWVRSARVAGTEGDPP